MTAEVFFPRNWHWDGIGVWLEHHSQYTDGGWWSNEDGHVVWHLWL